MLAVLEGAIRVAGAQRRSPYWIIWVLGAVFAVWAIGSMVNAFPWQDAGNVPAVRPEQQTEIGPALGENPPAQSKPENVAPATSPVTWPFVQGTWANKELEGVRYIDWIRPFENSLLLYANPSMGGDEIWRSQDLGQSWEYLGFGCNACEIEGYTTVKTPSGNLNIIGFRGSLEEELYMGSFMTTQALLTNNHSERSSLERVNTEVSRQIWGSQKQEVGWTIFARDPANPQLVFVASQVIERTEKIGDVEIPISFVARFNLSKDAQKTWEEISAEDCEPYNSALPFTSIMVLGQEGQIHLLVGAKTLCQRTLPW